MRPSIWSVVGAIEAVVVKAADETAAEMVVADMRHAADAQASDTTSVNASDASPAKAAHVTTPTTKATDVTSAKAAHVASAKAATTTVSPATAAAARLCTSGKQAAGEHCARQNHHHSSSHIILHWDGRMFRHRTCQTLACLAK